MWRACERLSIQPPGIARSWDDCDIWAQARIIAYEQIREHEDLEYLELCLKSSSKPML